MIAIRLALASVAAAAACVGAPVLAEVGATSDAGFVTHGERAVPAPPAAVWAALLAPAGWWDPAHTWTGQATNLYLDAEATGCFCEQLAVPAGADPGAPRGSVEHMHIIHVAPGRLLRMTGGLGPLQAEPVGAVLTISLAGQGAGTRITFEYRVSGLATLKGGEIAGLVDAVLTAQLARLAAAAAPPNATGPENKAGTSSVPR